jgi:hypothetical protein
VRLSFGLADDGRRPGGHDAAAFLAGAGAHVDDPVGGGHHAQLVLHHNDRVAGVNQAL